MLACAMLVVCHIVKIDKDAAQTRKSYDTSYRRSKDVNQVRQVEERNRNQKSKMRKIAGSNLRIGKSSRP